MPGIRSKLLFLSVLVSSLTLFGCSSSGGDSTPANTTTFNWTAGVYTGTFTETGSGASGDVVLLVTSDNRFALAATDGSEYNIGTVSGSNLSTTAGFTATQTAALSGTFSDSVTGLSGTFTLTDAGIYNRPSDLSELVAQWTDTTNLILYTIQASGDFDAEIDVCAIEQGSFATIDGSKNEYDFTLNVVACPGLEGVFTGLAFRDDAPPGTDNQLVIIAENPTIGNFVVSAAIKN